METGGPIYRHRAHIRCATYARLSELEILSVNPDKKTMTFKARNPYTGLGGMESRQRLECGHLQDLEGVLVSRVAD